MSSLASLASLALQKKRKRQKVGASSAHDLAAAASPGRAIACSEIGISSTADKQQQKQQKHEKGCQHEAAEQKGERTAMEDSCMQGVTALRAADATTAKVVSSRRPCLHIFDTGQSGSTMQRQPQGS
ncbi:hypothetical protein TEQG_02388 [Trichophyton equinum CBS 127.97]|uniref:Uncharacterized protein n=1 Tax=Trichophyton equinum (strain ATCC MYA-4606 / CBS 127.97) TaxID=559882 RepID=F2PN86_TRIEC|nr:hypothetical protein TEQG_02388 [Trichophyton equinum CBS 127.97]